MNLTSRLLGRSLMLCFAAVSMAACAPDTLYDWHGYNNELRTYYKNPGETEAFANKLFIDIEKAEKTGKVPPGIYAEYGYLHLTLGNKDIAIEYFNKEAALWPEARFLMTSVIGRLAPQADQTDEGSEE